MAPIATPLFFELALGMAVGWVGTWLAARASDHDAAALALALQVSGSLFLALRIIGAGVSVVVAQALGAGRRAAADAVARATLGAASWVGAACAVAAAAGALPLLQALSAPPEVLPAAVSLLRWLAPSLLLDAWITSLNSVLRAHLRARDVLVAVLLTNAVHLGLALAWMPGHGLAGFAAALALSRLLGLVLGLALWRWRLGLRPAPADAWRLPRVELAAVLHIGLPGAAENIVYRLCFMVSVAVAGQLGAATLVTQAYVLQFNHFTLLFGLATGLACEVVVGRFIGAGRLREADALVRRALARGLVVSVGVTAALALAGPWLLRAFTADAAIVAAGATLLWWTVLLEPGRTFNLVVINALRAAGDARYPVRVGAGSMLLVLAGGSWWLGHVLGLGLVGVWIAYAADEWLRGLLMWRRWRSLAWAGPARATHRQLAALQRRQSGGWPGSGPN